MVKNDGNGIFCSHDCSACFGKIMNCNVELLSITQAKTLKDVEPWMENMKSEIVKQLPNEQSIKAFQENLEEMNSKVKKATYLKNVQYKLNKPSWMEN